MLIVWLALFRGVASQNENGSKVSTKCILLLLDWMQYFSSYSDSKSLSHPLQFTLGGTDKHHTPVAVCLLHDIVNPKSVIQTRPLR